jgi:pyruvoyl-dependent arginine decarboxylase (PvlArgDC)
MPVGCYSAPADEHGHRLYVVKADCRSDEPGQAVAAGVGWYQWGDDRGVFVEHEAAGPSSALAEAEVARLIRVSLRDLCLARGVDFEERRAGSRTVAATVDGLPTTVLVLAIYQVEAWDMASPGLRDRVSLAGQ